MRVLAQQAWHRWKEMLCRCASLSKKRDASGRSVLLQQEWVQGEDEERSSSDGRGSSYFSGERLDQNLSSTASPMHSQQSLTGHVDRASLVSLCAFILSQHSCMWAAVQFSIVIKADWGYVMCAARIDSQCSW